MHRHDPPARLPSRVFCPRDNHPSAVLTFSNVMRKRDCLQADSVRSGACGFSGELFRQLSGRGSASSPVIRRSSFSAQQGLSGQDHPDELQIIGQALAGKPLRCQGLYHVGKLQSAFTTVSIDCASGRCHGASCPSLVFASLAEIPAYGEAKQTTARADSAYWRWEQRVCNDSSSPCCGSSAPSVCRTKRSQQEARPRPVQKRRQRSSFAAKTDQ